LVGGDGNVYEGRGWHKVGAHTYGFNKRSVGIALIGEFTGKYNIYFYVNATILLRRSVNSFDIFTSLAQILTDENPQTPPLPPPPPHVHSNLFTK
jgi:hypothetical protein